MQDDVDNATIRQFMPSRLQDETTFQARNEGSHFFNRVGGQCNARFPKLLCLDLAPAPFPHQIGLDSQFVGREQELYSLQETYKDNRISRMPIVQVCCI